MARTDSVVDDILSGRRTTDGWGTLQQLAQGIAQTIAAIPERRAQAEARQAEMEARQQNAQVRMGQLQLQQNAQAAQQKAAQMDQAVSAIVQGAMVDGPNGGKVLDRRRFLEGAGKAGVAPERLASILGTFDKIDESVGKAEKERLGHVADLIDGVLEHGADENAVTLGLAIGKANNWLREKELEPVLGALASGQDIKPMLTQIRDSIRGPKAPVRPVAVAPGSSLVNPETGQPVYTAPTKPANQPNVGSFEDYVTRTYGDKPTPEQILAARKAYGQADDRPRVNVSMAGGDGELSDDAVDYAAAAFRVLGPSSIPTRISGNDRARIMNASAKLSKAVGESPANATLKRLTAKADSAALTQVTKMATSAEAFESKALAQADLIADLSAKVPRTKYPIINSALQSGRTDITGDENATKFANAVETFAEEYAKVMTGATGSASAATDSARAASRRLISTAMSKGTLAGILDQMKWEMKQTMLGYGVARESIANRIGDVSGVPPQAPTAPRPVGRYNPKTGKVEPIQ